MQTQKCLLVHRQLQDLLASSPARTPSVCDSEAWRSKPLSLQALEGSPLDLLEHVSPGAATKRRDELRSELAAAEQEVHSLQEELRAEDEAAEKFQQALEEGTKAELRRLQEQVAMLEADDSVAPIV
ncbi:unnamed protein product [Effrenium voratum]|nr:unnamed protein product [Effrenium voratum]